MEVDPTPTAHSHIVSVQPCYPSSNMSSFLPEFKHPMLSIDGDVLLPLDAEDEGSREPGMDAILPSDVRNESLGEPVASTQKPEDELMFHHYRGPSDQQGRKREIMKYALNVTAWTEEGERVRLAENKLEEAAKKIMSEEQGIMWSSHNSRSLYMTLSGPCKNIMQTCRKHASNLVIEGFDLCLSIWSEASESAYQKAIIVDLLDNQIFPPKFLMELGMDNEWHFLENEVVCNIILNTVYELNLIQYLEELDSLACTAAVTVYGALEKMGYTCVSGDGKPLSATFKELYTKLMNYIQVTIKNSPELLRRWESYKKCIKARLAVSSLRRSNPGALFSLGFYSPKHASSTTSPSPAFTQPAQHTSAPSSTPTLTQSAQHPHPINRVPAPQLLTHCHAMEENWHMTEELMAEIERVDYGQALNQQPPVPGKSGIAYAGGAASGAVYICEVPSPLKDPVGDRVCVNDRSSPKDADGQGSGGMQHSCSIRVVECEKEVQLSDSARARERPLPSSQTGFPSYSPLGHPQQ
ncbi:hypothetical protein BDR05DRAFT_1006060 [Suillus weaverae]|nr:hypothetical protein BDR05DRAFT_1006060 [Suillus weaverae]